MYIDFKTFKNKYLFLDSFDIVETKQLFFLWKKSGIPSSFGKEKSVLDLLEENYFDNNFTINQKKYFTKKEEFGLLNRLDNDTSGFLYFAKNKDIYETFKNLQKQNSIKKIYYANVDGKFTKNKIEISYPIMHKNKTKMIVIKNKNDIKKGRGKLHFVKTFVELLEYDKKENTTWLKIIITKGIRHQIRAHLSSINFPIIGDKLYGGKESKKLYLFSVGLLTDNL